ncbi:hypothetical protein LUZ60_006898 [Juncus effusus]|nr:hypothetical protein LUZ60_006898 [Juncus effusus]
MCAQHVEETATHLFLHCDFASLIWRRKGLDADIADNIGDFWREQRLARHPNEHDAWGTEWLSICWTIWKARNQQIFGQKPANRDEVIAEIARQTINWRTFC